MNSNGPNNYKGKFPTPIERFIQRIQNYFSVYNPPEYLNDLQRPGINNPEDDGDQTDYTNETHIVLPCNGTSTIVIIPVPLESENFPAGAQYTNAPDKLDVYGAQPSPPKPDCLSAATTPNTNCPEVTTASPKPPTTPPCAEETTTTSPPPKCPPEATTPKPKCPEATTPKPKCPEATTPKPKCPEATTPGPKCPEATTPKAKCPETTTRKPECPEAETQKSPHPPKQNTSYPKPISGYGSSDVPPLNLVAQPVLGSTVVYFYKQPSTTTPPTNPPSYYMPSTQTPYNEYTSRPKPPMLRLKQLLFPRLYAAFHSDKWKNN